MDSIERIKQINEQKAVNALNTQRHSDNQVANLETQETIVKSFKMLVDFLDNKVTKTQVLNQFKEISTPDAFKVVEAINSLHATLGTFKNVDLSDITGLMKDLLRESQKSPKEFPKFKDPINYSESFTNLEKAVKAVENVVKQQKLIAEAPIVNIPETQVKVEPPDLKPLQKDIKDIVKAVNGILIPKYKTDNKEVEKLLKKSNQLLKSLLEKPVSSGGGGGSSWTAIGTNGFQAPLNLDASGNLKTVSSGGAEIYKKLIDDTTTTSVTYIGEAALGTALSASSWRIKKIDESASPIVITWTGTGFTAVYDNRVSETYG